MLYIKSFVLYIKPFVLYIKSLVLNIKSLVLYIKSLVLYIKSFVFYIKSSCFISSRSCFISSLCVLYQVLHVICQVVCVLYQVGLCVHVKMSACFYQVLRSCYTSRKEKIVFDRHYFHSRSALSDLSEYLVTRALPTRPRKEKIVYDQHENVFNMAARNQLYIPNLEEFFSDFLQLIQQCNKRIQENSNVGLAEFLATTHLIF